MNKYLPWFLCVLLAGALAVQTAKQQRTAPPVRPAYVIELSYGTHRPTGAFLGDPTDRPRTDRFEFADEEEYKSARDEAVVGLVRRTTQPEMIKK